jgi:hypothetical protein
LQHERGGDGVAYMAEDSESAIALAFAFDHVAVLALDARDHDSVVAGEGLAHLLGLALPSAGTSLDVGEQKGDHTSG